jgi:hypothetical protein
MAERRSSPSEEVRRLRAELSARTLEAEWLKTHYDRHLRDALARTAPAPTPAPPPPASPSISDTELRDLRAELQRVQMAESRYLDRISELKQQLVAQSRKDGAR